VAGGANSWAFGFNYYIRIGALHAEHDRNAVYWYPWNGTFLIGQGNGGSFSHQVNTADQYAIDVMMDEGTPIYAARAGYVSLVVNTNRYSKFDTTVCPGGPATCTAALTNQNHVVITHDDMTQAWYIHLMEVRTNLPPKPVIMIHLYLT
jgi:murein DD-endopeptidase MepM/ murein hydrolase activator NlpD